MSTFQAPKSARHRDLLGKDAGSENQCYSNRSDSDSESIPEVPVGRRREPRVGLVGGRWKSHTLAEKIAARTIPRPSGCWEVQGFANAKGYVQILPTPRERAAFPSRRAHVIAWQLAHGSQPVPTGMEVMHSCDNPRCVNPAHLSLGSRRDNHLDSVRKGRKNAFGHQKLDASQVVVIRLLASRGYLQREIASLYRVSRNHVSAIVHRKVWAHLLDGQSLPLPRHRPVNSVAESFE